MNIRKTGIKDLKGLVGRRFVCKALLCHYCSWRAHRFCSVKFWPQQICGVLVGASQNGDICQCECAFLKSPSHKDPLDVNEITGIFYQDPCHDCPFVYIGQSKQDLKSRLLEHKRAINYQRSKKSALCKHSITLDHIIDWNEATILSTEKDYTKGLFAESWLINKSFNVVNKNE